MRNTTGGGDILFIRNNKILLHNSGENYKGGFTVRNISTDEALFSIDPIGPNGYEEGGNYSTFNWLFAELRPDSSYYIYQYCPSNGMAMYRLYDRSRQSATTPIHSVADTDASIHIYPNPATDVIHISSPTSSPIRIYDTTGRLVKFASDNTINISDLAPSVYILTTNGTTLKFIKQ
jgi:hypothetical protein